VVVSLLRHRTETAIHDWMLCDRIRRYSLYMSQSNPRMAGMFRRMEK